MKVVDASIEENEDKEVISDKIYIVDHLFALN